jgi:hypothetical protein
VVNILPTIIGAGCVSPRAGIAKISRFRSALAIRLRTTLGAKLALAESAAFASGAAAGASMRKAFGRMLTFRWMEVWLGIRELQDGNLRAITKINGVSHV